MSISSVLGRHRPGLPASSPARPASPTSCNASAIWISAGSLAERSQSGSVEAGCAGYTGASSLDGFRNLYTDEQSSRPGPCDEAGW